MRYRKLGVVLGLALFAVAVVGSAIAASRGGAGTIPVIEDSQLSPGFTTTGGGAPPTATQRTIPNWWGSSVNPHNGIAYGYNMVGADPNTCAGPACSVTVETDITPINVVVGGITFSGDAVVAPTLASPQFALNDYGSTPAATNGDALATMGLGGVLSQGDAGIPLQLQDATMRAQFNQTGASPYHLILHPNIKPTVTINVPANQGSLLASGRGVIFASVDIGWWSSQIKNLETKAEPTHLPLYLTNNVMLHSGKSIFNCCVIGYHGTQPTGYGYGSGNTNGNANLQTFAWASYVQPGLFSRPNGGRNWALMDIHAISHEIAEWADDPFVNNWVEPWLTPTAPQYGCTGILETGDPVVGVGFAMGTNTFQQGPNPDGSQSADGFYHPEDEVYLQWFMRTAPNLTAEPTQSPSANVGRYTLMGDLNRYAGFGVPATGC